MADLGEFLARWAVTRIIMSARSPGRCPGLGELQGLRSSYRVIADNRLFVLQSREEKRRTAVRLGLEFTIRSPIRPYKTLNNQ